jgi:hypothetical protein
LLGVVSTHHLFSELFTAGANPESLAADRTQPYVNLWLHCLMPHPQFTMDRREDAASAALQAMES